MPDRYPRRADHGRLPPEPVIDTESSERLTARGITLVVPAYDEEDGIEGVIARLSGLAIDAPVEILVVDDGSRDGTAKVLERPRQ